MRITRLPRVLVCGVGAAAALLAAGPCLAADRTVVKLMGWGDQTTQDLYADFEAAFERDHPEVDLQVTIVSASMYMQKVPTMVAAGTAPDIMELDPESAAYYSAFVQGGAFMDLMPLVKRDKWDLHQYIPAVIDSYIQPDGTLPMLPKKISAPSLMMYNQDLFDGAGVPYPKSDWTWNDLVAISEKLTRDLNGDGTADQWALAGSPFESAYEAPLMRGWDWTSADGKRVPVNDPRFYDGLQFVYDLGAQHNFYPPSSAISASGLPGYMFFATGKAAMKAGARWYVSYFRPAIQGSFRWDATWLPIPAGGTRRYTLSTEAWGISKDSKVVDAAWTFLKWASGPSGSARWAANGGSVPAVISVANSDAYLGGNPPSREGNRLWLQAVDYAKPFPHKQGWDQIMSKMGQLFAPAWQGKNTFKSLAPQAERILSQMLAERTSGS